MIKVWHERNYRLEYDGNVWTLDIAKWVDPRTERGEIRVYEIHGDVTAGRLIRALDWLVEEDLKKDILQHKKRTAQLIKNGGKT